MSTTISGASTIGVTLVTPTSITATGSVIYDGSGAAVIDAGKPGTLFNAGQIQGDNVGISMVSGGYIDNLTNAKISAIFAITAEDNLSIINSGTISGAYGISADIAQVTNLSSGIISGGLAAVDGTLINAGLITSARGSSVHFSAGGVVNNLGTSSRISEVEAIGVMMGGSPGTVTNQGTINAAYLQNGGYVLNQNYIGAIIANYGINISGAEGSINNQGFLVGAAIQNGGYLTNGTSGTISGYTDGVAVSAGGKITNNGIIFGLGGNSGILFGKGQPIPPGNAGIALTGGGSISNNSTVAVIYGRHYGIMLGGNGTGAEITNEGTVTGKYGIFDNGTANNTITNNGTINGLNGISIRFGNGNDTLLLQGKSILKGTVVGGAGNNIVDFNYGSGNHTITNINTEFVNVGSFINTTPTLSLEGPDSLTSNQIFENNGVLLPSGTFKIFGTLVNAGTINGALTLGGTYFQSALASPEFKNEMGGIFTSTFGTAITMASGTSPTTIINAGTIEDTAADGVVLAFAPGQSDVLVIDPGSVIIGNVNGGGATGTLGTVLELAAGAQTGTISSIGTSFAGFAIVSITSGATWQIDNSTLASVIDDGTVILNNSVSLSDTAELQVGVNSRLQLTTPTNAAMIIDFTGTDGTLVAAGSSGLLASIGEFQPSDIIDLTAISFSTNGNVTVAAGNMLDIIENGTTTAIQFANAKSFTEGYFHLSRDSVNGTEITQSAVPCFLAGTQIRTKAGNVPVEHLKIGDLILDGDGGSQSIKWIGRRCYKAPFPDNPDIIPVLIKAGALAENMPDQDLYLSPLHAVLIESYLVPVGALVNQVSIVNCPDFNEIYYYHIETKDHTVIITNNILAETFIDEDSRMMFDNANEYFQLYPNSSLKSYSLYAPKVEAGPVLEHLRYKLALRAGIVLSEQSNRCVIGFLETADRRKITGWAYAPQQPHLSVSLDILNNGAILARTIANIPRPDVKLAGYGHGRCGFSITLPAPMPALMRHEISVRPAGRKDELLLGSPIIIDSGIAHDLLQAGGLDVLIESAARGVSSPLELKRLGVALEAAGKKIQISSKVRIEKNQRKKDANGIVLVIDEAWPTAAHDAGSNAILSHIEAFQQLGYIVAFCATSGKPQSDAEYEGMKHLRAMRVECYGHDNKSVETVVRALAGKQLAFVYLHRLAVANAYAGLVRLHAKTAKLIYAVADLHHLRLQRQAIIADRPDIAMKAKSVKAAEFWAMQMADCVVTHSQFEASYLRRECPRANVFVLPWAVAAEAMPSLIAARSDIAFVGGAGHAPNVDAVNYLAQNVMPSVWQQHPEIRCHVVGAGWPVQLVKKFDDRIMFAGHKPDLRRFLNGVRLTIAPIRFGAGVKGKVLESLACGTPCVLTEMAAEGIPFDKHRRLFVGDGDNLVQNVVGVYSNTKLQRVIIKSGLELIEANFSQRIVTETLGGMLGMRRQNFPVKARDMVA